MTKFKNLFETKNALTFYHVTKSNFLDSIKNNGLVQGNIKNKPQVTDSIDVANVYQNLTRDGHLITIIFDNSSEKKLYLDWVDDRPTNGIESNNFKIKKTIPIKYLRF